MFSFLFLFLFLVCVCCYFYYTLTLWVRGPGGQFHGRESFLFLCIQKGSYPAPWGLSTLIKASVITWCSEVLWESRNWLYLRIKVKYKLKYRGKLKHSLLPGRYLTKSPQVSLGNTGRKVHTLCLTVKGGQRPLKCGNVGGGWNLAKLACIHQS
jgi:hypothetical protein